MLKKIIKSTFIICLLCIANFAIAQVLIPKIYLYPEFFIPDVSTTIQFNPQIQNYGLGTSVKLEDELGFSSSPKIFRFQAIAGSGAQFVLSYMQLNRQGNAYLSRDIVFGDTVYHAGANTSAYFNSQVVGADWRLSIVNSPVVAAGISFGFRWDEIATGITFSSGDLTYSRDEKIGVPIPLVGLHAKANITPRLLARGSAEYFHINVSGYNASAHDHRFSLEYYFLKNVGIGCAYSIIEYDLNKFPFNKEISGQINYSLKGLSAFAAVRF